MAEPPHRKRFQIHLSTAIVMMFVAGGLIWANAMRRAVTPDFVSLFGDMDGPVHKDWGATQIEYGWPFTMIRQPIYGSALPFADWEPLYFKWAALNVFIASIFLLAVWYACEWLIRRRAAQKGA
jgi:hypothetical protein